MSGNRGNPVSGLCCRVAGIPCVSAATTIEGAVEGMWLGERTRAKVSLHDLTGGVGDGSGHFLIENYYPE